MSSPRRGCGPAGSSSGESVATPVDQTCAESSVSTRALQSDDVEAALGTSVSSPVARVAVPSPTSSTAVEFTCTKCEKGSSCWPVHVATQKLVSLRTKALGRRGGARVVLGDCDAVWGEFESLVEAGHRPTVKTYTALASALGECGFPEDCEDVVQRMRDAGETPDTTAWNVVAHAWCLSDLPFEAKRVVAEMLENGIAPNAATYPPLVAAFARTQPPTNSREIEEIIALVETKGFIGTNGNDDKDKDVLGWYERIYHAFVNGLLAANAPRDAENVLKRWNLEKYDMGRVADRKGKISRPVAASYGMIIDHYVKTGQMGEARRLLNQMQWDKVVPSIDIFNMLLRGYLASGNVNAAQDVFRELEGSGTWDMESLGIAPDVTSYTSLMDHWANQGDVVLAEKVLAKMVAKKIAPDERAFGSLIKAYARARDPNGAELVLTRMREFDAPPDTETNQKRHATGGRGKKSKNASVAAGAKFYPTNPTAKKSGGTNPPQEKEKYVGPNDAVKKLKPGVVLWTTVVSAYAAVGDMSSARRVVGEQTACPKSWRAAPNDRTFGHLAWGYGQLGDVAGVTATTQLMAEAGVSLNQGSEARKSLVRACVECGLPASHVDRMVENLGDLVQTPSRRKTDGWVSSKKKSQSRGDKPVVGVAKPPDAVTSSPGTRNTSLGKNTRPNDDRAYGVNRSGDAGWVCSLGVASLKRRTSLRVVANLSSRVPVLQVGGVARHARGVKGFKVPGVARVAKPLFA